MEIILGPVGSTAFILSALSSWPGQLEQKSLQNIKHRKNRRPYPVPCVLKCDIQDKRFYVKTGGLF